MPRHSIGPSSPARSRQSRPREAVKASRAASARSPGRSPRSEAEELSALIGTVYDAALDRERFVHGIELACRFLNCVSGVLGAADILQGNFNFTLKWGFAPEYWKSYHDEYAHTDPLTGPTFRMQVGEIKTGPDFDIWEQRLASDFQKRWADPQGFIDLIVGALDKSASGLAILVLTRHKNHGPIGQAEIRRMGLIVPHFRRAILIGKLLDLHNVRAAAFAEAIDALSAGVFLVNAEGSLVHANVSGQTMLNAEDPLLLVQGALAAADANAHRALRRVFASAVGGDVAIEARGVSVPLFGRGGDHFTAHILPLTSGARRQVGANLSAVAALFVRKAIIDLPAAIGAATQLYGFTPAEERVLGAIIEVGGLAQVAAVLGVAKRTVQTHLEHLFEKTGSRRQADLVKLIAGYDTPVRGRDRK